MIPLDVGSFCVVLLENLYSVKNPSFGFIPLIEMSSHFNIGTLNSENFCEKIISAGNLVMANGNNCLDDDELEMLTLFRIHRDSMTFMW